ASAALAAPAAGRPPADPAAAAFRKCGRQNVEAERTCYAEALDSALASGGAPAALALLDRLAALDPDVRRDGHMYAHRLGIGALKSLDEVGRVFASCSPGWQSGCYHGVIQGYFILSQRAGAGVTTATLDALCGDHRAAGNAFLLFQCTHGLGHGLDILHRRDLPRALDSCSLLSREPEREMCWAGVFMENIIAATEPDNALGAGAAMAGHGAHGAGGHSGHHGRDGEAESAAEPAFRLLDPEDLHYPCSALDPKYLTACYTIQTSAMLGQSGRDFDRVARECGRAPEKARSTCFLSFGRDVHAEAAGSAEKAIRLCGLVEQPVRPLCHRGVVQTLVNVNADPAEGIPYCRAVEEAESKRACYVAVGLQAMVHPDGPARRERACAAAEAGQADACLGRSFAPAGATPTSAGPARKPR
ncbi:MAG TPA: hypothetical protein VEA60_11380, partial [Allosphingosinicella sp.]|nr:hypothetical protein [Allosphingosinicella sp.]